MSNQSKQQRHFQMHPDLLWSVIKAQAGSQSKALLECVMNAVDAGATRCDMALDETSFSISDDGKGFQSRVEIENFFETFGTPHQEGDATFGKFRMGRGQLFSFARNIWRSGNFRMDVDIKARGLAYQLETDLPVQQGCEITGTWYERIPLPDVLSIRHELGTLIQWMPITVTLNGTVISKKAGDQKWTHETDEAFFLTRGTGGLSVYNLGALVRTYPAHQFGVSGIVLSKKQLAVNFARNDILLSECQVWRRIRKELDNFCGKLVSKNSLTDAERDALADRFARDECRYEDIKAVKLLIDASGHKRSLLELSRAKLVTVVTEQKDWLRADIIMQQAMAFVLRQESLDRFSVSSAQELADLLRLRTEKIYNRPFVDLQSVEFESVAGHLSDKHTLFPDKKLTHQLRALQKGLQNAADALCNTINIHVRQKGEWRTDQSMARAVHIGQSDVSEAWTDGRSYIVFEERVMRNLLSGRRSLDSVLAILLHEYCHDASDQEGHLHSPEFYEMFHDVATNKHGLAPARRELLEGYTMAIEKEKRKPTKSMSNTLRKEDPVLANSNY
jgi:hypothetical protein